jgi:glutamate carboxypeptidase
LKNGSPFSKFDRLPNNERKRMKIAGKRIQMRYYLAGLIVCLSVLAAQAQLSKVEKKVAASVDIQYAGALKLWEESVNINSGTMNFEGVQRVGELFKVKLDALGFETHWVDGKPFNRAGHLLAEHRGKGKTMLLIGHLDTVFEPSSPFQQFAWVNDSTVSGPGVGDMKGGNIVVLHALQALHSAGVLKDMNIIVYLGGDEEHSGDPLAAARASLIEAAKRSDIALGFEDGDGRIETANISRRSSTDWVLRTTGTPSHSSQIFTTKIGAGAIYEATRILSSFYNKLSPEENLTFNPGVIVGGTTVEYDDDAKTGSAFGKSNVVAKDAVVAGDIRAISPEQLVWAQNTMKSIVAEHLPQTNATLIFGEGYPALAPSEGNKQLLSYFDRVSKDLGFGPVTAVNPRDAGAADISFTSGYVSMAMDGLGLRSNGGHTINETADPRSISIQAKRAAILIYRLTSDKLDNKR